MNYDRRELKREVKLDVRETRPSAIVVTLVFLAVTYLIDLLLGLAGNALGPGQAAERLLSLGEAMFQYGMSAEEVIGQIWEISDLLGTAAGVGLALGLVSSVVDWTLEFGYRGWCLGMVRQEDPGFDRLLCAFPQWGWVLLTQLLICFFTALWAILLALGATAVTLLLTFLLRRSAALAVTLSAAAWLAAGAGIVCISLRYSMAGFVLLDEKVDALEAIKRSKAMLRGRKWHLFALRVSFIGWYLLVGLLSGLGAGIVALVGGSPIAGTVVAWVLTLPLLMWLRAYFVGADAKFYDWLRQADQRSGVWENDHEYRAPYLPKRGADRKKPPRRENEPPRVR